MNEEQWRVEILAPLESIKRRRSLLETPGIIAYDTVAGQLEELIQARNPQRRLSRDELQDLLQQHLAGASLGDFGVWVHYPWANKLVHLLPEAEFHELRTARNRNKITEAEQLVLSQLRIGIVGLSVGNASALTLALEGIGQEIRLADFDGLSVSNTNRVRASTWDLGLNKAVMTARQILEIDPFKKLQVYEEGVTSENIQSFLSQPGPLDVVLDECDDLALKIRLRLHARSLGIPVVMETSDRGMLDIERYDQEPDLPIFHGLLDDLNVTQLEGLSTEDKVPVVLRILGEESISTRMLASLMEIGTTIESWPQLASDISLGACLTTNAVRRLALGHLRSSGRYYVDIDQLIAADRKVDLAREPVGDAQPLPQANALPPLRPVQEADRTVIMDLLAYATTAPSGGNSQPWSFEWNGRRLRCKLDRKRSTSFLDYRDLSSHLAFGALFESLDIAAAHAGLEPSATFFPDTDVIADIEFAPTVPRHDAHLDMLGKRCTNRRLSTYRALTAAHRERLTNAALKKDAQLHWLCDTDALSQLGDIVGRGDRLRFLHQQMHQEMMAEVRWNAEETHTTRDGIDLRTLELSAKDMAGFRMVSSWPVMKTVAELGVGKGLLQPARKAFAATAAAGIICIADERVESFLSGGRALQRVWLEATACGMAVQPWSAMLYLFPRLGRDDGDLSAANSRELTQLRAELYGLFPELNSTPAILLRFSYAEPPTARSLRRGVESVVEWC